MYILITHSPLPGYSSKGMETKAHLRRHWWLGYSGTHPADGRWPIRTLHPVQHPEEASDRQGVPPAGQQWQVSSVAALPMHWLELEWRRHRSQRQLFNRKLWGLCLANEQHCLPFLFWNALPVSRFTLHVHNVSLFITDVKSAPAILKEIIPLGAIPIPLGGHAWSTVTRHDAQSG